MIPGLGSDLPAARRGERAPFHAPAAICADPEATTEREP